MKANDQRLIEYVVAALAGMTTEERVEAFDLILSEYCPDCGSADGFHCCCRMDE